MVAFCQSVLLKRDDADDDDEDDDDDTLSFFYRAMHFSAYARSWDRMSSVRTSVRPSVCNVGGL